MRGENRRDVGLSPRLFYASGLKPGDRLTNRRQATAQIPQMDYQFDDLLGRFSFKDQCNTAVATVV